MAKFNFNETSKTINKNGYAAYTVSHKLKLVTQVLTSFFSEKKFYGDNSAEIVETIKTVTNGNPQFVAKLAVYARREFNMRSISHVIAAVLAHEPKGKPYAKNTIEKICLRGDDVTEILACYIKMFGKPIPNSLRRGLKSTLEKFDPYTLAKYKSENKSIKMKDAVILCHPKPNTALRADTFKELIEGKIKTPLTWESELSLCGNNKETWERLIASGKIGYMALLRNLKNIIAAQPQNLNIVLERLCNPEAVKNSRQLPFRFLAAYRAVSEIASSDVFEMLEKACEISCENLPKLDGTTVIAVDTSGSMSCFISAESTVKYADMGALLGIIANRMCEKSYFYTFNHSAHKYPVTKNVQILQEATKFLTYGGTNMNAIFDRLLKDNIKADRIIVISDNECNCGSGFAAQKAANHYRKEIGCNCWIHAVDLVGYGTQQFCGEKTNILAGWSEKVLSFIPIVEEGGLGLIKKIENYKY